MQPDPFAPPGSVPLVVTVGIATAGRPGVVGRTLELLRKQTRRPDRIVVSASDPADLAQGADLATGAELIVGQKGLTRQRNAVFAAARDSDIVVFFDDDFVPAHDYLETIEKLFCTHPDVVLSTGTVLADGIIGPGLTFQNATDILERTPPGPSGAPDPIYSAYGCNMAVRMSVIRRDAIAFDEELPLYGWLEDVDFSRRMARYGNVVRCQHARGVHLGTKGGRQSGIRLGYSQIANPVYLMRKGSMQATRALWLMTRNIGMNSIRALRPEPHVDRAGRLAGNASALLDLLTGQIHPHRVLRF